MNLTEKKDINNGLGMMNVSIEKDEWKQFLEKAKNSLANKTIVPGFRKGKAPKAKIEQLLTIPAILREAANKIIEPSWKFCLDNKKEVEPFSSPKPMIKKLDEDSCEIEFSFDLKPELEVKNYKNIKLKDVKKENVTVDDTELEKAIKSYCDRFVMEREKEADEKINDGDLVVFDYEGFIDGKAFNGGKGVSFSLIIGSGKMIPGFENSMIGLKTGEAKIKVKFPKDYTPELSEKDAEFKLLIKSIKERIYPDIDEAFIADLKLEGVKNKTEFTNFIKENLIKQKEMAQKNNFAEAVIKEIANNSNFVIPNSAIQKQVDELFQEFEQNLAAKRISLEQYKKETGLNDEQIKKELEVDAKERLQSYIITDAIRKNEKFEISEAEILEKYKELSKSFNMKVEEIRNIFLQDTQIKQEIEREKILDFIYKNNG